MNKKSIQQSLESCVYTAKEKQSKHQYIHMKKVTEIFGHRNVTTHRHGLIRQRIIVGNKPAVTIVRRADYSIVKMEVHNVKPKHIPLSEGIKVTFAY